MPLWAGGIPVGSAQIARPLAPRTILTINQIRGNRRRDYPLRGVHDVSHVALGGTVGRWDGLGRDQRKMTSRGKEILCSLPTFESFHFRRGSMCRFRRMISQIFQFPTPLPAVQVRLRLRSCMYRALNKSLYVVARNFFLLLLNSSAWTCLAVA